MAECEEIYGIQSYLNPPSRNIRLLLNTSNPTAIPGASSHRPHRAAIPPPPPTTPPNNPVFPHHAKTQAPLSFLPCILHTLTFPTHPLSPPNSHPLPRNPLLNIYSHPIPILSPPATSKHTNKHTPHFYSPAPLHNRTE